MKRVLKSLLACVSLIGAMSIAWADSGVSWTAGPNGTKRYDTNNGPYIEETIGSRHWFGPEDEYDRRQAANAMEDAGYKPFHFNRSKNPDTYVNGLLPMGSINGIDIGGIESDIGFGAQPDKTRYYPPKPAGTEYVEIGWFQSDKANITAQILDNDNHKTISPYLCENTANDSRTCYFIVPWQTLVDQSSVQFLLGHVKPVVLPNRSIAFQYYVAIRYRYMETDMSRRKLTPSDASDLNILHQLDNSIDPKLPPLKHGGIEYDGPASGCNDTPLELTMEQLNSVKLGQSIMQVQCFFGKAASSGDNIGKGFTYSWKLKGGGYVTISTDYNMPAVVNGKQIFINAKWPYL